MPNSDIFAPTYDAFGQLRVDDPTQTPPPGLGSNIFKDRGAIERADFVGPTAIISLPEDNDVDGVDQNSDPNAVYITNPELFTTMISVSFGSIWAVRASRHRRMVFSEL